MEEKRSANEEHNLENGTFSNYFSCEFSCEDNNLTCGVCAQILQDPVELGCGHRICGSCVEPLKAFGSLDKTGINEICCPDCFTLTSVQSPSESINLLTEAYRQGSLAHEKLNCANGCGRNATNGCSSCQAVLCDVCYKKIHSFPIFSDHRSVSRLEALNQQFQCLIHRSPLSLFCYNHECLICIQCSSFGQHKECRVAYVEEYLEHSMVLLTQTCSLLEEKAVFFHQFQDEFDSARNTFFSQQFEELETFKSSIYRLSNMINTKARDVQKSIAKLNLMQVDSIRSVVSFIYRLQKRLIDCINYTESAMSRASVVHSARASRYIHFVMNLVQCFQYPDDLPFSIFFNLHSSLILIHSAFCIKQHYQTHTFILHATNLSATSVTIFWNEKPEPSAVIYELFLCRKNVNNRSENEPNESSNESITLLKKVYSGSLCGCYLTDISPSTHYDFVLCSVDTLDGRSSFSPVLSIKTLALIQWEALPRGVRFDSVDNSLHKIRDGWEQCVSAEVITHGRKFVEFEVKENAKQVGLMFGLVCAKSTLSSSNVPAHIEAEGVAWNSNNPCLFSSVQDLRVYVADRTFFKGSRIGMLFDMDKLSLQYFFQGTIIGSEISLEPLFANGKREIGVQICVSMNFEGLVIKPLHYTNEFSFEELSFCGQVDEMIHPLSDCSTGFPGSSMDFRLPMNTISTIDLNGTNTVTHPTFTSLSNSSFDKGILVPQPLSANSSTHTLLTNDDITVGESPSPTTSNVAIKTNRFVSLSQETLNVLNSNNGLAISTSSTNSLSHSTSNSVFTPLVPSISSSSPHSTELSSEVEFRDEHNSLLFRPIASSQIGNTGVHNFDKEMSFYSHINQAEGINLEEENEKDGKDQEK